jgi:alginate O-acetyltransferase complex protein AlgI
MKFLKKSKVISRVYLLIVVAISFIIFNADAGMDRAWTDLANMFGFGGLPFFSDATGYYIGCYGITLVVSVIGATPIPKMLFGKLCEAKSNSGAKVMNIVEVVILPLLLIVCTAHLVDGSFNPFLYFRF